MYRTQQIHFEMAHALASIATMCALPRRSAGPLVLRSSPWHNRRAIGSTYHIEWTSKSARCAELFAYPCVR